MNSPTPPPSQFRSRLILLLVAAIFLGSFGIAAIMRFTGWTPAHSKNFGELLQPPKDLGALRLLRADGQPYAWAPNQNLWRIVVVPAADCQAACTRTLDNLHRIWLAEGRKAERIDVLWFGALPAGPRFRKLIAMRPDAGLAAALPEAARPDTLPIYLIDPSGFLVMHYHAGFEPGDLKKDLDKLLK